MKSRWNGVAKFQTSTTMTMADGWIDVITHVVCLQAVNRGTYQPPKHHGFLDSMLSKIGWTPRGCQCFLHDWWWAPPQFVISFQMTILGHVVVISILLSFWGWHYIYIYSWSEWPRGSSLKLEYQHVQTIFRLAYRVNWSILYWNPNL